jgi:polyisoprenoid-binding protein YceI
MKNLIYLALMLVSVCLYSQTNNAILGKWTGNLEIQGMQLPLVFNIKYENESLVSSMDSPAQKAYDIPVEKTTFSNNELSIELSNLGISYTGKLENDTINGTLQQGGMSLNLSLKREDEK